MIILVAKAQQQQIRARENCVRSQIWSRWRCHIASAFPMTTLAMMLVLRCCNCYCVPLTELWLLSHQTVCLSIALARIGKKKKSWRSWAKLITASWLLSRIYDAVAAAFLSSKSVKWFKTSEKSASSPFSLRRVRCNLREKCQSWQLWWNIFDWTYKYIFWFYFRTSKERNSGKTF